MRTLLMLMLGGLAATAADTTLKDFQFGKIVLGPEVTKDDLKGKVVVVEHWGLQCGPCIAAMPHLNALHDEYGDFGLVIVGIHRQEAKPAELKDRSAAMGLRFSIADGGHVQGLDVGGIPHTNIFDVNGKMIHDGRPNDIDAKVRKAVNEYLLKDLKTPTTAMKPIVALLEKGSPPLEALKKLGPLKTAGDKATAEQAKGLSDRMTEGAKKRLEEYKTLMKDDPIAAYEGTTAMAARWKGFENGTKAAELVTKLKADKTVTAELKVRPTLDGIKKLDNAISAVAGANADYQSKEFKQKYGQQVKDLKKAYDSMKRQYPDARGTKEAKEIVEKYDLPSGEK